MKYANRQGFIDALKKNGLNSDQLESAVIILNLISWRKTDGEHLGIMHEIEDLIVFMRKAKDPNLQRALVVYDAIRELRYVL